MKNQQLIYDTGDNSLKDKVIPHHSKYFWRTTPKKKP